MKTTLDWIQRGSARGWTRQRVIGHLLSPPGPRMRGHLTARCSPTSTYCDGGTETGRRLEDGGSRRARQDRPRPTALSAQPGVRMNYLAALALLR